MADGNDVTVFGAAQQPPSDQELCCVCTGDEQVAGDQQLLRCAECKLRVHPECYGLPKDAFSDVQDDWYCTPCSCNLNPWELKCEFCGFQDNPPSRRGDASPRVGQDLPPSLKQHWPLGMALKPLEGRKWAHVACAKWVPGLEVAKHPNFIQFQKEKKLLTESCVVCSKAPEGVPTSTAKSMMGNCQKCNQPFHGLCIIRRGSRVLRIKDKAFCPICRERQINHDCTDAPAAGPPPPADAPPSRKRPREASHAGESSTNADDACYAAVCYAQTQGVFGIPEVLEGCAGQLLAACHLRFVRFLDAALEAVTPLLPTRHREADWHRDDVYEALELLDMCAAHRILHTTLDLGDRQKGGITEAVLWHEDVETAIRVAVARLHMLRCICGTLLRSWGRRLVHERLEHDAGSPCVFCCDLGAEDGGFGDKRACSSCALIFHPGCVGGPCSRSGAEWYCPLCMESWRLLMAVIDNDVLEVRNLLINLPAADPWWVPRNVGRLEVVGDSHNTALHVAGLQNNYDLLSLMLHPLRLGQSQKPDADTGKALLPDCLPANCQGDTPHDLTWFNRCIECDLLLQNTFQLPRLRHPWKFTDGASGCEDLSGGREAPAIPCNFQSAKPGVGPDPIRCKDFTYLVHSVEGPGVCFDWGIKKGSRGDRGASGLTACHCRNPSNHGECLLHSVPGQWKKCEHGGGSSKECNYTCACAANRTVDPRRPSHGLKRPMACHSRPSQLGSRVKVEIAQTATKGWGLFAREPIAKGTFIGSYTGEVVTEREMERREHEEGYDKRPTYYSWDLDGESRKGRTPFKLDSERFRSKTGYCNHTCSNCNVAVECFTANRKVPPTLGLIAVKDIRTGDELLIHYGIPPPNCQCDEHPRQNKR